MPPSSSRTRWATRRSAYQRYLALALLLGGCAASRAPGLSPAHEAVDKTDDARKATGTTTGGLDAALSSYRYPFPVEYRSFTAQGTPLRMAYMDVRPASAGTKTVVLLHGKNFSGAYWENTAKAMVDVGYRVVIPDQIGFGKSSKPSDYQYTFQALATQTRDLLDQLGIESAHIVGHSMGGMLATRFALMFPERSRSLVLLNPIGLEDWKRKVPYRTIDEWAEAELKKQPPQVRDYMQKSYFGGEWKPAYDPLLTIQTGWIAGPDWPLLARVSARTYDMIFTQPVVHEFIDLAVPTLLIIGQRDRTAVGKDWAPSAVKVQLGNYPELGRRAAAAIPKAELVELPGVGHVPQFEAPEATHSALLDYLRRSTPGESDGDGRFPTSAKSSQ